MCPVIVQPTQPPAARRRAGRGALLVAYGWSKVGQHKQHGVVEKGYGAIAGTGDGEARKFDTASRHFLSARVEGTHRCDWPTVKNSLLMGCRLLLWITPVTLLLFINSDYLLFV